MTDRAGMVDGLLLAAGFGILAGSFILPAEGCRPSRGRLQAGGRKKETTMDIAKNDDILEKSGYLLLDRATLIENYRKLQRHVGPEVPVEDLPIGAVTNGVHVRGWVSHDMAGRVDSPLYGSAVISTTPRRRASICGWAPTPPKTTVWRRPRWRP